MTGRRIVVPEAKPIEPQRPSVQPPSLLEDVQELMKTYGDRLFLKEPWEMHTADAAPPGSHIMLGRDVYPMHARIRLTDRYGSYSVMDIGFGTFSNKGITGNPHRLISTITDLVEMREHLVGKGHAIRNDLFHGDSLLYTWEPKIESKAQIGQALRDMTEALELRRGYR